MTVTPATFLAARAARPPLAVVALAGAVVTAATLAFALAAAAPGERLAATLVYGLMVGAPSAVGVWALHRRPGDRFAVLLLATALLLSLTALAVSSDGVLYSTGRTAVWVVELALVYLLLAFPSGRLVTPLDRAVFRAAVLVDGLLYLP